MSNEVDKRIIEMEFKNDQFEKNAAKTLQTLQELKAKLNENFSTKGPEELNRAIKAVDVNPIVQGLETVQVKFSALQIAGKRIVENLTDIAMNAIGKVKNAIQAPLNQIISGGAARAQNIASAKFMLEGLGIEWENIVDDINYGVQDTAYGLDAAAKVASQLVASNVSLGEDMQASLRAVSGVAAMTNSTYEEIGHIFTSVAGQGKLMGMQLQQFSLRGLNVAADLAKAMNTTEAAIRDMVTKGQIDFMTFAKAMDELYGEHAKEANKTFSGALSNTKAALSRLGADIQTQKFESLRVILLEVTTQLKDLKKAIKPAEDAVISMMEAVGNLVANFIKSINIRSIVEKITPAIKKVADYIKDFANAWRELREEATPVSNIAEYVQKLKGGMTETKEATDDALTSLEKLVKSSDTDLERYAKNAWAIWNEGKFGNGQDRIDALGEDYELTQEYVNKMIELGWDEAKMQEFLTEQREKAQKQEARQQTVNRLKTTVSKVLEIFGNVKRVFTNITTSVVNIIKALFGGLGDAFSGKGKGFLDGVVTVTGAVADFSDKIAITKDRAEKIRPITKVIGDAIIFIAKGLYNAGKFLIDFIKKASGNKVVRGIFEAIAKAIQAVFDTLGKLYTKVKESGVWDKFVDILKTVGTWLGERLIDAINTFGDVVTAIGGGVVTIFEKLAGKVKDTSDNAKEGHGWLSKIADFFKEDILSGSWLTKLKEILSDIFGTGKDVFQNAYQKASDFIKGMVAGFKSLDKEDGKVILGVIGQIAMIFSTVKWLWSMVAVNKSFKNTLDSFNKTFEALGTTIKKYGKRADAQRFESFAKSVAIIVGSLVAMMLAFAWIEGKGYDAKRVAIICGTIVGIISIIIGAIIVLTTWLGRAADYYNTSKVINILGNTKIPAFALSLFAIGYLLKTLIDAVLTMYNFIGSENFNGGKLLWVNVNLALLLGAIMAFVAFGIKAGSSLHGMTGFALTIVAMSILFNSIIKGFKKVLKLVTDGDVKRSDIQKATNVIGWLTIPLYIFGILMALVSKIPTNAVSNTNPFKGMFGMLAGLAVLIRFGFQPLLDTIADLRGKGKMGDAVISDFKKIVNTLYIFVGLITIVVGLLDRSIFTDSHSIGSEFVDGKYVGEAMAGGWRTMSGGKLIWGVVGVVAGLALLMYAISSVMKNMQGVDPHSVSRFKDIVNALSILIGAVTIISVIGGVISNAAPEFTLAVLAIAGVIASVAAVLFASAYAFKTFTEAFREIIDYLPQGIKRLTEFFELIEDYDDSDGGHHSGKSVRDKLIKGVKDTTSLIIEGLVAGISTASAYALVVGDTIIDCIVSAIEGAAESITKNTPRIKHALTSLRDAIAYALVYAIAGDDKENETAFDAFKGIAKYEMTQGVVDALKSAVGYLPGGESIEKALRFGEGTKTVGKMKSTEEIRKEVTENWKKLGKGTADDAWNGYRNGFKDQLEENATADEEEQKDEIVDILGYSFNADDLQKGVEDKVEQAFSSFDVNGFKNKIIDKITNVFGGNELAGLLQMGDFGSINSMLNINFSTEQYEGLLDGIDPMSEDGINEFQNRLANLIGDTEGTWAQFGYNMKSEGENAMDQLGDGIRERIDFVNEITQDAADASVDTMRKYESKFYDVGKMCTQGFADGLINQYAVQRLKQNAYDIADKAKDSVEDRLKVESPSKVFRGIGRFVTLGLAEGIKDTVGVASSAADEAGVATILSMRETIKRVSLEAVDGIGNPRITPILDLSNVTEGVGLMNGLFDNTPAYELAMATSGEARLATRTRMTAIYQNGSNYDDTNAIGAINSLNAEVSTLKDAITGMQVVIDGRALVGQIATPMDKALGRKAMAGRRKV